MICEVQPGDVKLELLTLAQHTAAQGAYAHAMAGYIRWLAPRLDLFREEIITISRDRRTRIDVAHARTADILGQLFAAWTLWLRFVVDIGVVTRQEGDAIEGEVWSTLSALAAEQHDLQRDYDPVDRFFALLNAILSSGKAHVASAASTRRH